MFTNTLTLTINAVARTLTRINQDNYGSEYTYSDGVEQIVMKIRHSDESSSKGLPIVKRHNVFLERTVFATPTASEKYFSTTITLRNRLGSDPAELLKTWQGFDALVATLDDGLVIGDN